MNEISGRYEGSVIIALFNGKWKIKEDSCEA